MNFRFAEKKDIDKWMNMLEDVKEYFPGLNIDEYRDNLKISIDNKEALIAEEDNKIVGELAFSACNKELCFLAVHNNFRHKGIAKNLVKKMISLFDAGTQVFVITFRAGDNKGNAARKLYLSMGFEEAELINVFDYPCQKLIYNIKNKG